MSANVQFHTARSYIFNHQNFYDGGLITMRRLRMLEPSRNTITRAALLLLVFAVSALMQTVAAQQYQVTYLDSIGGNRSRGNSINNREWVAGFSFVTGNARRHATLWRDGSVTGTDLGTLGLPDKNSNVAWPVKNNRGFLAGISQTDTPEPNGESWSCAAFFGGQSGFICLGFRWHDDVMTRLLPLAGGNNSFATGADNNGRVVGWAENGVHDSHCVGTQVLQFHPVVWAPGSDQPEALPLFSGDSSGAATAINNRGQIVGISGVCDQAVGRRTAMHALLWDKGTVTDLGNLGAKLWITPMALNQSGDIVGFGATSETDLNGDFLRAFIWTRRDGMKRIDPLPGLDHVLSQATGINESGQVVGSSCTVDGACLGFLWQNGVIKNLNDPDVTPGFNGVIINAQDINDDGEITGRAFDPAAGDIKTFIAVPISETASLKNVSLPKAQIVLPENVRQILRQQRGIFSVNPLR